MARALFLIMNTKGNVLFLILIAVALFAALSYAVTGAGQNGGKDISDETADLDQAELNSYTAAINGGKMRLELVKGCTTIDYTPPEDWGVEDKSCHMFHPDGAGVAYRDVGLGSDCDLPALSAVGDRCGLVVYAGVSGGRRIYTTASDLGNYSWNNGSTNWYKTGVNSVSDGLSNTNTLIYLNDIGAPYVAAQACRALGSKWYLPARDELSLVCNNAADIGNFDIDMAAWASGEHSDGRQAHNVYSGCNASGVSPKSRNYRVRCVRRD